MKHVMIDLETMSTQSNAAIVSIGAVAFDESRIYDQFYTPIDLNSCIEHGLHVEQRTVEWWETQDPEAVMAWKTGSAPNLLSALTEFNVWIRRGSTDSEIRPWGNGSDFDIVILGNAHRAVDAEPPWKFYNHRCFRTIKNLLPLPQNELRRTGVKHHALNDAQNQAVHLQEILKKYELSLT